MKPKFVPVIVTRVPVTPIVGLRLVIAGVESTVKTTPFESTAEARITTFPVVAPNGTVVTMLVALQLVGVATIPLNLTRFVP